MKSFTSYIRFLVALVPRWLTCFHNQLVEVFTNTDLVHMSRKGRWSWRFSYIELLQGWEWTWEYFEIDQSGQGSQIKNWSCLDGQQIWLVKYLSIIVIKLTSCMTQRLFQVDIARDRRRLVMWYAIDAVQHGGDDSLCDIRCVKLPWNTRCRERGAGVLFWCGDVTKKQELKGLAMAPELYMT